jgi:hypothetical protein
MKWGVLFSSGPQWTLGQEQLSAQQGFSKCSMQADLDFLPGMNESSMFMEKHILHSLYVAAVLQSKFT